VNAAADADPAVLRLSMDAKATVKVGDFSRGGKKRVRVKAADHDFKPKFSPKKWQGKAVSWRAGRAKTEEPWKGRAREGRETINSSVTR